VDKDTHNQIAVIGAGIGGLATAARLASRGFDVHVYEKLDRVGGRVNIIEHNGFKFDTGPSFILMREFFDEFFQYCGKDIADYIDLQVLEQNYKIFYADGEAVTFYRDMEQTKKELERLEPGAAAGFDGFLAKTGGFYDTFQPLLYTDFKPHTMLNPSYWHLINKINPFENYWQLAKKFFRTDKLCYAFSFQAMFLGVSPFEAPSFYSMITYADHAKKIYHPMGGMYQIARSLHRLGQELGVTYHLSTEVQNIRQDNGRLAFTAGEKKVTAEQVVVNADYTYTQEQLLQRKSFLPRKHSCSAYLIYLGLKEKISGMQHHNLFFAKDPKRNIDQIFSGQLIPDDASFYTHIPTHMDPSLAPPGKDVLYILVPVSNLQREQADKAAFEKTLRASAFERISQTIGRPLQELVECEFQFLPADFIERYNLPFGSAFGLAHTLGQSAFFRPSTEDAKLKNLHYVGASTQPGGGLPPVLAGSRIVADTITQGEKLRALQEPSAKGSS
jgi:phytoene desaturase